MLFDVFAVKPGVYWFVKYDHDDRKASDLRDVFARYIGTVNNEASASQAAYEDHAENRGLGGLVTRVVSAEDVEVKQ